VQYRKRKIFHANQSVAQLVDLIKKNGDEKYLLPSSGSRKPIQIMLDKEKVKYTEAVMYKTLPNDLSDLKIDNYDLLIFFSPSGVESLFENFPEYKQGPTLVAGFGPSTLKAIKKAGMRTDIEAPTKTAPSMTMALDQFLRNTIKK
jgi:uroporphyrinogen-III synthase